MSSKLPLKKKIKQLSYFFKKKNINQNLSITRISSHKHPLTTAEQLRHQLQKIDNEINETSKRLVEAQSVNLRSYLNSNNGMWANIQRKRHRNASLESIRWHLRHLKELIITRVKTQGAIDRINGEYWSKRLKLLIFFIVLVFLFFSMAGLVLAGLMTTIYLTPIWGSALLVLYLIKKTKRL